MLSRRRFLGLLGLAPLVKETPPATPAAPESNPEVVGSINHAFHDFVSFDRRGGAIATDTGRMGTAIGREERSAFFDEPYCETCAGGQRARLTT